MITLVDEEGNEESFELVDILEVESERYAVLVHEAEEGARILRMDTDEDGDEVLSEIDDDEEFDRVVSALRSLDFEVDLDDEELDDEELDDEELDE